MSNAIKTPEVVYNSESPLKQPGRLAAQMFADLAASRELGWRLFLRNIQGQYRRAFLGMFWAFMPPLIMAAGFTLAGKAKVITVAATDIPYPAYVIISMVLWQTFLDALNGPIQALQMGQSLLSRVKFPRETIVLAKLGEVFFHFGIKLILIVAIFAWYRMSLPRTLWLAPLALIDLIMLGTVIGLLIAPFAGLYDDVSRGLAIVTSFWIFLTPVVYPLPSGGVFGWIVKLNPVTHLLVATRELATTGAISNPDGFWIVTLITCFGLLVSWVVFRVSIPFVIERMGN